MGFFLPRKLLRERLALTSPFHPCLYFSQRTGGVFSVTLSVTAIFQPRRPRLLRGMLPYGVRTFLQQTSRFTSDHLPSAGNLSQSGSQKTRKRFGNLSGCTKSKR